MVKKTKFSQISNVIFLTTSIFILFFIWVNYYTRNLTRSIFSAILVTITFLILYTICNKVKINRNQKTLSKTARLDNLCNTLLYEKSDIINQQIIDHLFPNSHFQKLSTNHYIIDNQDVYFCFDPNPITISQIATLIQNRTTDNLILYCIRHNNELPLPSNICINIYTINDIIDKIESPLTNKIISIQNKPKLRLKDILCVVCNSSRSKGYLGFGTLLIISSLFTPFSTYYIITGTILIIMSIFSRFNKIFN